MSSFRYDDDDYDDSYFEPLDLTTEDLEILEDDEEEWDNEDGEDGIFF